MGNYWHPLWETDGKDYFHKQSFSLLPPYLIWLGLRIKVVNIVTHIC